jgi:hypothetical protein
MKKPNDTKLRTKIRSRILKLRRLITEAYETNGFYIPGYVIAKYESQLEVLEELEKDKT